MKHLSSLACICIVIVGLASSEAHSCYECSATGDDYSTGLNCQINLDSSSLKTCDPSKVPPNFIQGCVMHTGSLAGKWYVARACMAIHSLMDGICISRFKNATEYAALNLTDEGPERICFCSHDKCNDHSLHSEWSSANADKSSDASSVRNTYVSLVVIFGLILMKSLRT